MNHAHPVRILLIGDSTVLGSVPRLLAPHADNLEDVVRKCLAADTSLPPAIVLNKGQDNDTIHRMLETRYEQDVARLDPAPDFIFIRFGINDRFYLRDFHTEFRPNYRRFIARIRHDLPRAAITLETIIPYCDEEKTREVNDAIREIAREHELPICDTHAAFARARKLGPEMFTYRRVSLDIIPRGLRSLLPPGSIEGDTVTVLDHSLDAHFSQVPGWFSDRHPNHAGFHVIGKCLADYLAPRLRATR